MGNAPHSGARSGSSLRLLLELGRGGMGVVFLALAQGPAGFAKLKVVKRLRPELAAEPRAVEMFLAEARLAARLRHPNVVQTNEVGFDGRHYFLEMEYLEGQSFDALLRRAEGRGGVPLPVALHLLAQTCAGLHHAHELRDLDGTPLHVVHRDVSPHNVFVTYDGHVKVLDFGIAKAVDSGLETQTGLVKGKARYMAPEQAARGPIDRRADVFAVGVILWQVLTGQRLWGDLGDFEIFVKLQTAAIPSPRSARPDVPEELDAMCVRALSSSPDARPATAAELGAAIEAHLESTGARVGPREVAALMASLFADRRADVEREIEACIKSPGPGPATDAVPMLVPPTGTPSTGSAALSHASSLDVGGPGASTRLRQRREIRGLRRMTALAIGVALLASGSVAIVTLRARRRPVAPAPTSIAPPRECAVNAGCAPGSICRKAEGRCVAPESPECRVLAEPGDVASDATIWLGLMMPTSGPRAEGGKQFARAVDLARRDFAEITRGLPAPSGAGASRPLGFVSCDDAAHGEAAARHLVFDVGVPAIIGFGSSEEVVSLASSLFVPNHVLAVASVNQSTLVTKVPQPRGEPRLVLRTATGIDQLAAPVSQFVSGYVEPHLREQSVVAGASPLRVAVVRPATTTALSIADALFATVRFNGKSALENGDAYRALVFSEESGSSAARSPEDVVEELLRFRPHVVLAVGEGELTEPILAPLERRWPKAAPRPTCVFTGGLNGEELWPFLGTHRERRRRYFGVQPPATTMANARFTMRYNEVWKEQVTLNTSPAGPYDAAYLLAYAAFAVGDAPLTGSSLSRAVGRLAPPGPPLEVGPTRILEAIELLRNGQSIDLQGAAGRLDFDPATGESPADAVVQCVGVDERGQANDGIDSGLYYDAPTRTLRGELRCP